VYYSTDLPRGYIKYWVAVVYITPWIYAPVMGRTVATKAVSPNRSLDIWFRVGSARLRGGVFYPGGSAV